MRKSVLLLCLLAPLCLSACSDAGEQGRREAGTSGTLPEDKAAVGEVPIRHDFSFTAGVRMKVPRGFPDDVPLYPGAGLKMSQRRSFREFVLILGTSERPGGVEEWHRSEMVRRGWRLTREAALDSRRYLRFEKDGRLVTLAFDATEGETLVSIACTLGRGSL